MNLTVYYQDKQIFCHNGHWLHPLFALEDFLQDKDYHRGHLRLEDKLIGRGAAVLIHTMGILACHGKTVSRRGLSYCQKVSIQCTYDHLVDRLDCQTELLLGDTMDTKEAYRELSRRAGRL